MMNMKMKLSMIQYVENSNSTTINMNLKHFQITAQYIFGIYSQDIKPHILELMKVIKLKIHSKKYLF